MTALLLAVLLLQPPAPEANEVAWSAYLATQVHGEAEYVLPTGARVDVLTDDVAWEVEWCHKWPESIGQAVYYAAAADRRPGVWLLKRGPQDDENWNECLAVIQYLRGKGVPLELRTTDVRKGP
jgi:hypothetical protein